MVLGDPVVRDVGLLDAAAHRPRASAFGSAAYPTVQLKAAALLEAVVRNRALVDGNNRLGWAAAVVFHELNGLDLRPPTTEDAVELVVGIAAGQVELAKVAERLAGWTAVR